MPTLTIEYTTETERLQYERMIAYVQELTRLGATAAAGTVLDTCERFVLDQGRPLLRTSLETVLQARADAEKKSPASVPRAARRGRSPRPSDRSG